MIRSEENKKSITPSIKSSIMGIMDCGEDSNT